MGLRDRKVDKPVDIVEDEGILYLIEMDVDGKRVVKIGLTRRPTIDDRLAEIALAHFKAYRQINYMRPKRFRKTSNVLKKEQLLLGYFASRRYTSEKPFGGCTELVDVDIMEVVQKYEEIIDVKDCDLQVLWPEPTDDLDDMLALWEGAGCSE